MNGLLHVTPTGNAITDKTMALAIEMARKTLADTMYHRRTWFKTPFPDGAGRYYIIQSHMALDEVLPTEFPNECVYYREYEDGWAISVGY